MAKKKERQKDRSTDNTMAKIKKGKRNEAQTLQWPKYRKAKGSKHRQYNGQNKERQKERCADNTMAKIKKDKRIEAQTMQWSK
jgi:hypothetical protein